MLTVLCNNFIFFYLLRDWHFDMVDSAGLHTPVVDLLGFAYLNCNVAFGIPLIGR